MEDPIQRSDGDDDLAGLLSGLDKAVCCSDAKHLGSAEFMDPH